jgi:flavodoxin
MKKALIVYQSKTGITKKFGEEIGKYLSGKGIDALVIPVQAYTDANLNGADYVLLGCWTAGLMLLFQHPDREWKKFTTALPKLTGKNAALFTTYKIATGSMFKNMKKYLGDKIAHEMPPELKSRNGSLSEENKVELNKFIA